VESASPGAAQAPEQPRPPRQPTVLRQYLVVFIGTAVIAALGFAEAVQDPKGAGDQFQLLGCLAAIAALFTQATWITMDLQRRDREVGWWRFGVILCGPLVIWLYLVLHYRARALYLIPLSLVPYIAATLVPRVCAILALRARGY